MTLKEWLVLHKREFISVLAGILASLILVLLCFYSPAPKLINAPTATKDATVTLQGKAWPGMGIVVYDKAGNALIAVNSNDKGEFTLANIPVGEGTTELRLRAVSSAWRVSFPRKVLIRKDTIAPALSVQNLQGATVTGSNTVISGKAEPGSTVTVNGVKTTVAADGTWTATISLKPGSNSVTVTATDAAGNATTQTQNITYTPAGTGAQTGTATVTASAATISPGSLPAGTAVTTTSGGTGTNMAAPTAPAPSNTATPAPTPSPTPAPIPTPAPQPVLAITSSAWVSNSSPNERANETIYASVKDNYGRPVADASVVANVYYKNGTATYSLRHTGNGVYSASFKLNDKYVSGYRVGIEAISRLNNFVSTANTSFTPQ